eukprot:CAMPEP_0172321426 /NCGR_PEP_ID=MMETSP1058-20130122/43366_1 /TAXON_ID=83371 /ORGANISM="Detonula confervacea, Strain CCMP 353" /LENGTH=34 /DNA_ID= /DNA_START= /DNA_END= /DNA_ORIENTATION=
MVTSPRPAVSVYLDSCTSPNSPTTATSTAEVESD